MSRPRRRPKDPACRTGRRSSGTASGAKSPGDGLPPYELERFVGRRLRYPVSADTALGFELLEDFDMEPPVPVQQEGALAGSGDGLRRG